MKLEQTFMNFMLRHQESHHRTYNFLVLLEGITTAAKYIQHYYHTGSLRNLMGEAGLTNVQGESVMKMDVIANAVVLHYLRHSHQVIQAVSEEENEITTINPEGGRYFVYFDPLDGSSNVKHNLPVGFMFGIAKRNVEGDEDLHLRRGDEYRAAGIFIIPTGVFILALKDSGVWHFQMDETATFVRPTALTIPEEGKGLELSYNAARTATFARPVQEWIALNSPRFDFRYMGALAGDFLRILRNGGMFMYPAIVNHENPAKNRPKGKLRLLYEANVAAFIAREAGGFAVDEQGRDILAIEPEYPHQRTALYVGSRSVVEDIRTVLTPR